MSNVHASKYILINKMSTRDTHVLIWFWMVNEQDAWFHNTLMSWCGQESKCARNHDTFWTSAQSLLRLFQAAIMSENNIYMIINLLEYAKKFARLCAGTTIKGRQKMVGHCGKAIYILKFNTRREISCISDNGGQRRSQPDSAIGSMVLPSPLID